MKRMKGYGIAALSGLMLLGACSSDSSGSGSSVGALQQLAEEYPTASAAQTKSTLDRLTVRDWWVMELVQLGPAFKLAVMLKTCQVDPNITWHTMSDGKLYNCASAQAEWNETVQLIASTGVGSLEENVESGRMEVIIYEKCQTGQIDKGSCDMYYGIQQNVANQTAQTNETIIDNMGNQCRIGVDANCYP